MTTFIAKTLNLKTALSVVALGTGEAAESIQNHALFVIQKNKVILYATNEDKIALSHFPTDYADEEIRFTASPKRIQELISSSDSEQIKFVYDEETKTLNIYASDDSESYLSFASFEPDEFLSFNKELSQRKTIKSINANVLLDSIKFTQGFLPNDDKNKKYSNLFINEGTMYGSNGSTKIGAFKSPELNEIETLSLRKMMLPLILTLIDKTGISNVIIKASEKFITFSSEDGMHCFGFRKPVSEMPKFPISMTKPDINGFNIDHNIILKKLKRLSLTSWESIGIKIAFEEDTLLMETITDRISRERMSCQHISGDKKFEFVVECNQLKNILDLFKASNVDIFIDAKKCTIYSTANIVVEEEGKDPISKPFTAIGFITLARVLK